MQKLKRKPLLPPLADTLKRLTGSVKGLIGPLTPFGKPAMTAALIVVFLILFLALSGCAPAKTVRPSLPPQADAREIPDFQGQTVRDSILYLIEMREGWMQCEADKAVIRKVYGHE